MDVDANSLVEEVKVEACNRPGLLPDEHELRAVLYIPIPDSHALAQDPATGKWRETGEKLPLRNPARLKEDELLSKLGIPESVELLLVWKLDSIRRCPVCRVRMKLFCLGYGVHTFSEVLVCSRCNRADRVLIGEDHDFSRDCSGSVLWQTDDVLIVRVGDEVVIVYELYGEPHASVVTEDRIRCHREYTLTNPNLEKLEGTFRDRIVEVLRCDPSSYDLHNHTLALRILRNSPRAPDTWARVVLAELEEKCSRLPGPGNSAEDFLRRLAQSLETLDVLGVSLDEQDRNRLRELVLQLGNPDGAWTREIELKNDPNGKVKLPIGTYRAVSCAESHVEPTYCALKAFIILDSQLEQKHEAIEFLREYQFPDGRFNNGPSSTPKSFLSLTFHAVEALNLLGEKPRRTEKCISWLQGRQELNPILRVLGGAYGGFVSGGPEIGWSILTGVKKSTKMQEPSLRCTYEAVKALSMLHSTPKQTDACIRYVLRQRTRFGFGSGWSFDALQALLVLETLDALKEIDRLH